MRRPAAFAVVSSGIALAMLGVVMSSSMVVQPFHEVIPSYDVTIQASCESKMQKLISTTNTDVNMPVMRWLRIKQLVESCGGHVTEVK